MNNRFREALRDYIQMAKDLSIIFWVVFWIAFFIILL